MKRINPVQAQSVWHPVDQVLPKCDMEPNSFGVRNVPFCHKEEHVHYELPYLMEVDPYNNQSTAIPTYKLPDWCPLPECSQSETPEPTS